MDKFDRNLELSDGLETEYLRLLYYDFNKYYNDIYKSYEYKRLCTIINGEKKVRVNGSEDIIYNSNQYLILPPHSSIEMEINKPTKALVLEISDKLVDDVIKNIDYNIDLSTNKPLDYLLQNKTKPLHDPIKKIIDLASTKQHKKEFLIDLYAQEIMFNLITDTETNKIITENFNNPINLSTKIMKEKFKEKLTISDIASEFNMSVANFSSKFKKIMNMNPNDYLTNIKLQEAKKLLRTKNVTEVAYELGYENISHFILLFKRKFGLTPKQYMIKNLSH